MQTRPPPTVIDANSRSKRLNIVCNNGCVCVCVCAGPVPNKRTRRVSCSFTIGLPSSSAVRSGNKNICRTVSKKVRTGWRTGHLSDQAREHARVIGGTDLDESVQTFNVVILACRKLRGKLVTRNMRMSGSHLGSVLCSDIRDTKPPWHTSTRKETQTSSGTFFFFLKNKVLGRGNAFVHMHTCRTVVGMTISGKSSTGVRQLVPAGLSAQSVNAVHHGHAINVTLIVFSRVETSAKCCRGFVYDRSIECRSKTLRAHQTGEDSSHDEEPKKGGRFTVQLDDSTAANCAHTSSSAGGGGWGWSGCPGRSGPRWFTQE